ncbi:F0F1 ATP synthase subunit A [Fluviicola taffensis]|uniref:ATP synthase subunit a n=1 Tax=Fluviicola taffensis (strain DSM 16823 / NCIMB 13979 / RW262) TaxID=755732 RepID=F2IAM1_FLUTR|nr:F0F1 ATP synthase subunit A [Fluviicola taffensis]AEA43157.1 ATP synthase subunit a [Fluviicola taffensis DSM 16823]
MSLSFSAKRFFSFLVGILIFSTSFASEHGSEEKKEFNVGEMIMHHVSDAHEWHLWGGHHDAVSVYLPVILIDGGLKTFSSKHFYHGEHKSVQDTSAKKEVGYVLGVGPAAGYAMFEEEIYKLNNSNALEINAGKVVNAELPFDFSITKNVLSLFMGAILILLIMSNVARFYKKNGPVAPKGLAKYLEVLIVMVRDDIAKANIDHHKYQKYVPYLLTIFFFIFINNLLGLVPFLPGGANLTGNITVTLFLAVCTLLVTVFSANKNYWLHIFAMPGVPKPLLIIMIPIELVGILTKPFALMVRLFANMTAGHIIVLALVSIIFINQSAAWGGLSVPMALFISVLELLVAFLQAFLFAMLSALFIGAAVEEAHH